MIQLVSNIESIKGNSEDESNAENNKDDDNLELSNIYSMEPDEIRENIEIQTTRKYY